MANQTITFSKRSGGWTSFWSYAPDWMLGMNSSFYTWKDGSLYKHDTNSTRNQFYGTNYSSSINTTFSQDPLTMKMYKTLSLDSNRPWETEIITDLSTGHISASYYEEKEGGFYGYIRRNNGVIDNSAMSTQGIGALSYRTLNTLVFSFNLSRSPVSVSDQLYVIRNQALLLIGTVTNHTSNYIIVNSITTIPNSGEVIVLVKNSTAESYGARGYYMDVQLTNSDTTEVEIFSIASNVFKSFT